MALHDERRRIEALFVAVRRKAGAFGRLNDEQRDWLAEWQKHRPPFEYEAFLNSEDDNSGPLRSDIRQLLYGDVPQILMTDTDATAGDKWQRYLERH
ncbi:MULTISPECIES: hypothetical protein [unclassified Mesorhizobium]|uniref:hypothetical protein n=1 Tax=unclassified Mesorhizobium TaxID=325217 RepID=UPI003335C20C